MGPIIRILVIIICIVQVCLFCSAFKSIPTQGHLQRSSTHRSREGFYPQRNNIPILRSTVKAIEVEKKKGIVDIGQLSRYFAVFIACISTFQLRRLFSLSAPQASSLIGLFSSGIPTLQGYSIYALTGSFSATSLQKVFRQPDLPLWQSEVLLGVITAIVFAIIDKMGNFFIGVGGRLGLIAFFSVVIMSCLAGNYGSLQAIAASMQSFCLPNLASCEAGWLYMTKALIADSSSILPLTAIVASCASLTFQLRSKFPKWANPVFVSSLLGLISTIVVPLTHSANSDTMIAMVYVGTFIGMSNPLWDVKKVHNFLLAALAAVVTNILMKDIFIGVGGKLGFFALSGVFAVKIADKVQQYLDKQIMKGRFANVAKRIVFEKRAF